MLVLDYGDGKTWDMMLNHELFHQRGEPRGVENVIAGNGHGHYIG